MLHLLIKNAKTADPKDVRQAACETKSLMLNELNLQIGAIRGLFAGDDERTAAFVDGLIDATVHELVLSLMISNSSELNLSENTFYQKALEDYFVNEKQHYESLTLVVRGMIQRTIDEDTKIPKPDKYRGMGRRN